MTCWLTFEKLEQNAIIPKFAHETDSGFDFYALEDYIVKFGETTLVRTGVKVLIPKNYEIQIRPRSGLALKEGIMVVNSPGTIDEKYTAEIKIILTKIKNNQPYQIKKGDRIAQGVLAFVSRPLIQEGIVPDNNERGNTGFGDSGK